MCLSSLTYHVNERPKQRNGWQFTIGDSMCFDRDMLWCGWLLMLLADAHCQLCKAGVTWQLHLFLTTLCLLATLSVSFLPAR